MAATNSVRARTGNVSAGTSVFSMVVLEAPLPGVPGDRHGHHPGRAAGGHGPLQHLHPDLDAWVKLFSQLLEAAGAKLEKPQLYDLLYQQALQGDAGCGGLVKLQLLFRGACHRRGAGRPLLMRRPQDALTLPDFMRAQLYAAMATLSIGMEILWKENVQVEKLTGHGGLFKTPGGGPAAAGRSPGRAGGRYGDCRRGRPPGAWPCWPPTGRTGQGESLADYLEKGCCRGGRNL